MKKLIKKLRLEKRNLENEKGQSMLEYVMLLAVVAIIVLAFKGKIMQQVEGLTNGVAEKSNQVLQ